LLLEQERRFGYTPKPLEDRPSLAPDLARILEAFRTVSRCRPQSMGDSVMAIGMQDILVGWEVSGLKADGLPMDEWVRYALALDDTVIEFYNSRKPSKK
jgi:hypothetical protein